MRRPLDWFSSLGLILIVLIVVGLIVYSITSRPPSTTQMRLPRLGGAVEKAAE